MSAYGLMFTAADLYSGRTIITSVGTQALKSKSVQMQQSRWTKLERESILKVVFDNLNDFVDLPKTVPPFGSLLFRRDL